MKPFYVSVDNIYKDMEIDLAERMKAHVVNRGGLSKDEDGNPISPNGAWAMMLQAHDVIIRLIEENKKLKTKIDIMESHLSPDEYID
jgi:hypothetical protein